MALDNEIEVGWTMHQLEACGLIKNHEDGWGLTEAGFNHCVHYRDNIMLPGDRILMMFFFLKCYLITAFTTETILCYRVTEF
jgi:hypothetical protein